MSANASPTLTLAHKAVPASKRRPLGCVESTSAMLHAGLVIAGLSAALMGCTHRGAAMGPGTGDTYPPARTGLRGSHDGAFERAHEIRFGAFNADMPYDRFVREQLAGDELVDFRPGGEALRAVSEAVALGRDPRVLGEALLASLAELPSLLEPLLRAGRPGVPLIQSLPFLTAAEQFAAPAIASVRFKNASSLAYDPLPTEAIATLVEHLRAAPFASDLVGFFPLRGAIARVDPAATAFVHRRALFDLQYQAYWWDDAAAPASIAWRCSNTA